MFFVALVSAFFVRQNAGHSIHAINYVSDWHPLAIPPILWINTAILLLSSLSIEIARQHLFHEVDVMEEWLGLGRPGCPTCFAVANRYCCFRVYVSGRSVDRVAATCIAGPLLCDEPEQPLLLPHHCDPRNPSWLGILALATALCALFLLRRVEMRQIVVDCTAWYWHTMGIFWAFLFVLLIIFNRTCSLVVQPGFGIGLRDAPV